MINVFSVCCGLGFAPYLLESLPAHFERALDISRVVRQGGSGLIIRSDGELLLRYRNRECAISVDDARHFETTIGFRAQFYDTVRLEDEVVIATVGGNLLISHPQSELWLDAATVAHLLRTGGTPNSNGETSNLPDWLSHSAEQGRLLLSDRRSGRWVLLGSDHLDQLERRLGSIAGPPEGRTRPKLPTIQVKGVTVHLHSVLRLTAALEDFATGAAVESFEEMTPSHSLAIRAASDCIQIGDGDRNATLSPHEARRWVSIVRDQLHAMNLSQTERSRIRTVFADGDGGRWFVQWGDEVFVSSKSLACLTSDAGSVSFEDGVAASRAGEFLLMLDVATGNCVALTEAEERNLGSQQLRE